VSNEHLTKLRNDTRQRPEDVEAWYGLATAALEHGDLEQAAEAMTRVLDRLPDHLGALRGLAALEGQLGHPAEAIGLWRRVVRLSPPGELEPLTRLGIALSMGGEHDEAIQILSDVAERADAASAAHADLGMALLAAQRSDDALGAFGRACDLDPQSAQAHCGLGLVYLQLGRWWEAAASFKRTEELAPQNPVGPMNLAMVLETLGEHAQARQALARAAALAPDDEEIRQALGRMAVREGEEEEVTRPAARDYESQASITGDLDTFKLLDVLDFLRVQNKTGALFVSSAPGDAVVRMTDGRVTSASAPGVRRLVESLWEEGLVPRAAVEAAVARLGSDRDEALTSLFWYDENVDRTHLAHLVQKQVLAALDQLLGWPAGAFSFHASDEGEPPPISFDLQEVARRLAPGRDQSRPTR
jgi:Flp pilus assembly protein TadD